MKILQTFKNGVYSFHLTKRQAFNLMFQSTAAGLGETLQLTCFENANVA
jgi:hypothetical protein